jgi:UDP-N-acetyl-D-galactosamine dehydrogenase
MSDLKNAVISVIGLGYVGLPVAVSFAEKGFKVVGFDINQARIKSLNSGVDATGEIDESLLNNQNLTLTNDPSELRQANFYIITVPTPIDAAKQPDLTPLKKASEMLSQHLKVGDIVVYESTVYPGVTEDFCLPILEQDSKLKGGKDFWVGYSPERINPGDKEHTFTKIKKVVSGQTPEVLEKIASVYGAVVEAGIYQASSIKVAEAAKVIENTQRDLNVAFVNELTVIFNELGISVYDVLDAANTKWNFLPFQPGLVGGHCIGVDPYYLTHLAEKLNYHPEVISAGRRINDRMGKLIAEMIIKEIIRSEISLSRLQVGVMGFTFKPNCPDIRNTKVFDMVTELESYQVCPLIYDPLADNQDVFREYQRELSSFESLQSVDVIILAVAHDEFLTPEMINFLQTRELIFDIKNMLPKDVKFKNVVRL